MLEVFQSRIKNFSPEKASLFACVFIDSLAWGMVFPILSGLFIDNATHIFSGQQDYLAWRNMLFQLTLGAYCFSAFLASPILGILSDIYGRKRIVLCCLGATATGFAISVVGIVFSSISILITGKIIEGLACGSLSICQAAISDLSKNSSELKSNMAKNTLVNGLGLAAGPLLGTLLLETHLSQIWRYALPFFSTTVLLVIAFLMILCFFKDAHTEGKDLKVNLFVNLNRLADAFHFTTNGRLFLILALTMLSRIIFYTNMPTAFYSLVSASAQYIGWLMTYYALLFTLGLVVLYPFLEKRLSTVQIIIFCIVAQAISYLIFSLNTNVTLAWLLVGLVALTTPLIYVCIVVLISNNAEKKEVGKAMGIVGSVAAFSWGVGPPIVGFLALAQDGKLVIYGLSVFFMVASGLILSRSTKSI